MFVDFCSAELWVTEIPHIRELYNLIWKTKEKKGIEVSWAQFWWYEIYWAFWYKHVSTPMGWKVVTEALSVMRFLGD